MCLSFFSPPGQLLIILAACNKHLAEEESTQICCTPIISVNSCLCFRERETSLACREKQQKDLNHSRHKGAYRCCNSPATAESRVLLGS